METTKKLVILVLACFLMFSLPAVAGDLEPSGAPASTMKTLDEVEPRIPISQDDLPLTITEPNSYYLVGDITFMSTSNHAITIECNDVTIDLMGYTLEGSGSGGISGVYMSGRSNVEIRNGTIRDFGYPAIWANGSISSSHRVINMRFLSNMYGVILYGSGHLVKDCTSAANSNEGINTGDGSTVTGNTCYNNGGYGIGADSGSTVTGNTCYSNDNGINASGGSTVTGNTARNNTNYGIYASSYCLIAQNAAYGNATANLTAGAGSVLVDNCAP